jgi:hypothetical protein
MYLIYFPSNKLKILHSNFINFLFLTFLTFLKLLISIILLNQYFTEKSQILKNLKILNQKMNLYFIFLIDLNFIIYSIIRLKFLVNF